MKTPDQVAKKWSDRLSASTQQIQEGVDRVTVSPTTSAAASADKWQTAMAQARTKDKFKAGLARVSLQDWQSAMKDKGIARISSGASAAVPKFASFMGQLLPYVDSARAKVKAMPKLTLQDSINRSTAMITEMSKFKRTA